MPPRTLDPDGQPRRVGVELEYGGVACGEAAALVARIYGGQVVEVDPHRCDVRATRLGDFTVELDLSAAHPKRRDGPAGGLVEAIGEVIEDKLRSTWGQIGRLVMPFEVAAPPVAIDRLEELRPLFDGLRRLGAEGTEGVIHAFGLHFNPQAAALDGGYILAHLRAYLLMEDWLRARIEVAAARRLSPFIDRFPRRYALKLLEPAYAPTLDGLIADYLDDNPSRNRGLDLLPLFAWLAPAAVRAGAGDQKVRPRPTFHYRLPDSRIDDPYWDFAEDWNRWVEVERLAEDAERLDDWSRAYREHHAQWLPGDWASEVERRLAG